VRHYTSGVFGILVQRTTFFDGLGSLHATLVVVFAALFGFAALACIAMARQAAAAFLAPSDSLFSFGGSIDPLSFLVLQLALLLFASVAGVSCASQAGGGREGLLLAIALGLALLPVFVTAELAICAKRWRDTTERWPSYGALAWAALLGLATFHEMFHWLASLPGELLSSSSLHLPPLVSLAKVLCYLVSLAACVWCYLVSRQCARRSFFLRVLGYGALGFGSFFFVTVGVRSMSPIRVAIFVVVATGLISGAYFLVFRRDEKVA